jgi:hypothetical protein
MQPREIYLSRFPFGDVPGKKLRPVLLRTGAIGFVREALVAYISSVIPAHLLASDFVIDPGTPEFRNTHLKVVSCLRLHKLPTVHTSSLVRFLGVVDPDQFAKISSKLQTLLRL